MVIPVVAMLLAFFALPSPWGTVLAGAVIAFELVEKAHWIRSSRRIPIATGREALLGQSVTALSACCPDGRVRFHGETWSAHCLEGAQPGAKLVIEDVSLITLIVRPDEPPRRDLALGR